MDIKKIIVALSVLVCVSTVASAQDYTLEYQMKQTKINLADIVRINTARSNELRKVAVAYQKRIMDYNGLTMVNQFTSQYDYKTKMCPLFIANLKSENAAGQASGCGYFSIDYEYIERLTSNNGKLDSFYSKLNLGQLIAHEMSHNLYNHPMIVCEENYEIEKEAEMLGEKMMANLPEGGLGGYLVHMSSGDVAGKTRDNIFRYYEQKAGNRISIKNDGINQYSVYYKGSDGKDYKIRGGDPKFYSRENDVNYLAGQIAYCIAMGAFNVDNLEIARGTTLKGFPQDGAYIICRSPKLPNGYKVLTDVNLFAMELGGNIKDLQYTFEESKKLLNKSSFEELYNIAEKYMGAANSPRDKSALVETLAIAFDCNQR